MTAAARKELIGAIRALPQSLRAPTERWFDRVLEAHPGFPGDGDIAADVPERLARLVAGSEFAGRTILRQGEWFVDMLGSGRLAARPDEAGLVGFAADIAASEADAGAVKQQLRRFRDRWLTHILWRALDADVAIEETLAAQSVLADQMIAAAHRYAGSSMQRRFGDVIGAAGDEVGLVVLAMGKLGGRELNFSSDVDLIFLYPRDGRSTGQRELSAHEYFTRQSRQLVSLLDEVTPDGFVFRVDTRLRPFGESGPPVTSFAALESYLLQQARGWERYAYVKSRVVAPAGDGRYADELMQELIRPFVYRRYLDYGVFESLREMKSLIAAEVRRRELGENIKLGPGGIREIEFIVQSLQLVRGGSDSSLRRTGLLEVLPQLAGQRSLGRKAVAELAEAYRFMRRLENHLQAVRDQQTHDLPADPVDRLRVALAMGYDDWSPLEAALTRHRQAVAAHFARIAFGESGDAGASDLPGRAAALWSAAADEQEWQALCAEHGFRDSAALGSAIASVAASSEWRRVDTAARKRLREFVPRLVAALNRRRSPTVVFSRVMTIVRNILGRSAYVALLNENPPVLERLLDICESSDHLAQQIGRYPLLLDEMLDPLLFSSMLSADSMQADLAHRMLRLGEEDSERRIEMLARFQRATLFRIAVADVGGGLPIMKVSDRLTDLAEIVLREALEIAWSDLTRVHGSPAYLLEGRRRQAGFAVVAYGKLGGIELSYSSDLDLVFLHDSGGEQQQTDGDKPLDNGVFFARLVRRLVHFLTTQTASGALYEIDTRLRPSGRSGLLVTNVEAFERYQDENAWTWEHQALLRSRVVAGDAAVARAFERVRAQTLKTRVHRDRLAEDVRSMRRRMRKQLDRSDTERFDLKQGRGGIGDIEFIVQYLVLANAATHPAVIFYTDNIRQLGTLAAAGCLGEREVLQLQEIYRGYRLCLHRLVLDGKPPLVAADEFTDDRDYVSELWQRELGAL